MPMWYRSMFTKIRSLCKKVSNKDKNVASSESHLHNFHWNNIETAGPAKILSGLINSVIRILENII